MNTDYSISAAFCRETGRRNREAGLPCQDTVRIRQEKGLLFFGLADGQSGTTQGAAGGLAALKAVQNYIQTRGLNALLHSPFPDELPCMLMQQIRNALLTLAQRDGCNFREYASTLLVLAVEPDSGQYMLVHLGDGCVIGAGEDGAVSFLSTAENGLSLHHTWLTTSQIAVPHLRISCGSLSRLRRVLLLTDGCTCLYRGRNLPRQTRELLRDAPAEHILSHIRASDPADDASCILLELPADSTESKTFSGAKDNSY